MAEEESEDQLGGIGESINQNQLENSKEETAIFDEENKRKKNKHKHRVAIISLYFILGIGITVIFIRVFHIIAPDNWMWLDDLKLQAIDKLLFSGTLGTILGKYGKNLFD
ncbi:hypothetical protein ACNKXS_03335 [Christiangramia marina]|uniref:hypothetical protein n=1 Tax=Christiangramia marina TaxID=409436 RepID=UPI003AA7B49A